MKAASRSLRIVVVVAVMAGCVGATAGCRKHQPSLRVGINLWPGYSPLFLAQDLGRFGRREIQLITCPSNAESLRAYSNGAIDAVALTLDETLLLGESLPGQCVALVFDYSRGADAILARPPAAAMADLRHRRVGVEQSALGAFMLARALELSGMDPREVTAVSVPLAEHAAAYRSGRVDAVVTFDPERSRILAEGAREVFTSASIPGEIVDVLVVRPEFAARGDRRLQVLMDGWFRALDELKRNPAGAARLIAPRQGLTPEAFLKSLAGLQLVDRSTNLRLLGGSPQGLDETLRRLRAVMLKNRLLTRDVDAGIRFDDRFVRSVRP